MYVHTQLYVVGTADSALIREVTLIKCVLYREVPMYVVHTYIGGTAPTNTHTHTLSALCSRESLVLCG